MPNDPAVDAFFAKRPQLRFVLLGHGANRAHLNLRPLGVPAEFLCAEDHPELVARYHAANAAKFGGALTLPGWVLVDFYLMPGAIAMVLDERDNLVAAWCGVPTVAPGVVMGVSLFSLHEGIGAAYVAKRLGLACLGARVQRGITQWDNRSLGTHTRLGPLRVVGPAPEAHGQSGRSLVYEVEIGAVSPAATHWIDPKEGPRVASLPGVTIVAPGLDDRGRVCLCAPGAFPVILPP